MCPQFKNIKLKEYKMPIKANMKIMIIRQERLLKDYATRTSTKKNPQPLLLNA